MLCGFLAALLAAGSLVEAFHHHPSSDDGHSACCANTCASHHKDSGSPAIAVIVSVQNWVMPVSQQPTPTIFSKRIFHPPVA
jgi:hypothetical protein